MIAKWPYIVRKRYKLYINDLSEKWIKNNYLCFGTSFSRSKINSFKKKMSIFFLPMTVWLPESIGLRYFIEERTRIDFYFHQMK